MTHETTVLLLLLSLFAPALFILPLLAAPGRQAKYWAMLGSLVSLLAAIGLYVGFRQLNHAETLQDGYALRVTYSWLSNFDVKFMLGVDGISIYLILLNALLFPLSVWFSWGSITEREKPYYALLLLLQTAVYGVFTSLDLLLFYVFFELGLIPMYFLIGIWGGKDRVYAAVKFFIYTLVGSLLLLVSLLYLGVYAGEGLGSGFTTDWFAIRGWLADNPLSDSAQRWLFWGFAFSFLIKVPIFPLHTWLPAAHVQAPTAGSVILAGVLLKMGTYGLIRFNLPFFPQASMAYANVMAVLGVIGVIYGALAAMVQTDIKKLVAYSSVAHMGFIVMGIFSGSADALSGAVLQMINHGISTGALFLIVGMIYDRRHSREIADFQGIATQMPVFTLFFMLATFSSIGLPGMNGFVGEFLILIGSYDSELIHNSLPVIAAAGVILAAVYMLWMFRRVMFGALESEENRHLTDINGREVGILMPLTLLMFLIGFWAAPFLAEISSSSDAVAALLQSATVPLAGR